MDKKKKPVSPIYAIGIAWLVYSKLFGLSGFGSLLKCAVVSWLVYQLVKSIVKPGDKADPERQEEKKPEKKAEETPVPEQEQPKSTGNPEMDAVVNQGRQSVERIRQLNDDIPDFKVSAQLKQIEILTASIIDQVEKKEDKLKQTRQFMNYYLPTTIKLLEQYVQMQDVGLRGENISAGMKQIEELLDKVIVAFQKQLDSLFERDVVDITADIQVMEQMMAAQGLTQKRDFD